MFDYENEDKIVFLVNVNYEKCQFHTEDNINKKTKKQVLVYAENESEAKEKVENSFNKRLESDSYYKNFEMEVCETIL